MDTMFDTLLQLPLFQGLAQEDLTSILGKVKLHFTKHKTGEVLLKKGTNCDRFLFILKGEVAVSTLPADNSYCFTEYFQAPYLVEPQSMFGMQTCYVSTYTAYSEVHTVSISKDFVLKNLFKYEIFLLNYMNIIGNRAQNLNKRIWEQPTDNLEYRIKKFVLHHIERPVGRKKLKIKMDELARIMNDTRSGISKALNSMQEKELIELHRGEIYIPNSAKLL